MEFINMNELKYEKGIYMIQNIVNGYVYIGQTKQPFQKRYWYHDWKLRKNSHDNKHLQNAWNLYGEVNFVFTVVKCIATIEELNEQEVKYIKLYKDLEKCYNIQDGGQEFSPFIRTEEMKKAIGQKNRINMLGKKHSETTKIRMSESHKGKHYNKCNYILSEEQAELIKLKLIIGDTPREISNDLNVDYKIVNNILSNNSWSHVLVEGWEDFRNNRKTSTRFTIEECVEVYELYKQGNYTQQQIADMYGKTRGTIINAIKRVSNYQ